MMAEEQFDDGYTSYYDDTFLAMELKKAASLAGELLDLHNRIRMDLCMDRCKGRCEYQKELDSMTKRTNISMWRVNVELEDQIKEELSRI